MIRSIEKFREAYSDRPIDPIIEDPIKQFEIWLKEAVQSKIYEPNAMAVATVGLTQRPSCRIVLLKAFDTKGFLFFSHAHSKKGEQINQHPFVALTFWWPEIHRQVRIEGTIKQVPRKIAKAYFAKRPRGSQIATLLKAQSEPINDRQELDTLFKEMQKKLRGKPVPCPKDWTGYCVKPDQIEFWQGRKNRLHDRIFYVKKGSCWIQSRLAP